MSPDDYRKRITDLGLDHMELSAGSVLEAKQVLLKVKQLQAELRLIKRELNLEVKQVKMGFFGKARAYGYEPVKQTIDDLLIQLDRAKLQLQQYIQEHK